MFWRSSLSLISQAVYLQVPRVQSVYMYITYLTQRAKTFGLGLRQHCLGYLNRLVAINTGQNYLDFRIGFMQ